MTYDSWKAHNPADEFLGPEPEDPPEFDGPYCPWPRCACTSPVECEVGDWTRAELDELYDKQFADVRDCLAREMGR